ncbi:MAG: PHP protein, DNA polymerase (family X) [Candidatus Magasanikbacteria bacterium]|nr:PHP protein, DNA polymerase (family X) [Candidatus Magasanikbacteria bacterium]
MPSMINQDISHLFKQMAIFLEMMDVPFKPAAYEKAAGEIEALDRDLRDIYQEGGLKALNAVPTVGESMAEKIEEFIKIGQIKELERLKKKFPVEVEELYRVEGLGPKTIKLLWQKLRIKNLHDLEAAAKAGKIAVIPHLGEKTEQNILRGLEFLRQTGNRKILGYILPLARQIEERFRKLPGVSHAVIAGSLRRRQETIGDIDLLVTTTKPKMAQETFVKMPEVIAVYAEGVGRSSVRLNNGMDADIRILPPESFGAALQYFTGDKQHNIELRKIAIQKGFKLSEYGLFRGRRRLAGKTEEEIYKKLGMDWMPPELRTASGEIAAAIKHTLPTLLPYGAVRGDLQVQTNWTDGAASLEKMTEAAMTAGLDYIAITDHTKTLAMTGGLDEKGLARQGKAIDKINAQIAAGKFGGEKSGAKSAGRKNFRVLKSAEVNILKDGSLDIQNSALKKLDVVSAAVHTNFKMRREEMTKRIIKALQNPYLNILFHPTGRLINQRPPYEIDIDAVIVAAKKNNVALELDCFPDRTDLKDEHVRKAVDAGVKIVIDTDAHSPDHLRYIELGEATARRGWAVEKDVLNALPLPKLLAYFRKKR